MSVTVQHPAARVSFRPGARARERQSGLTLIELMIGMLIASLMIGLVFSIYTRMSVAYRGQSGVSELQQSLQAAQAHMVQHLRMAGHLVPDGFMAVGGIEPVRPLDVQDNPMSGDDGFVADMIRVYYADSSAMASITGATSNDAVDVDDVDNFGPGDLALIVQPRVLNWDDDDAVTKLLTYDACLVEITQVNPGTPGRLEFGLGSPYNAANNPQCNEALETATGSGRMGIRMVYRFASRAYRIDPSPERRSFGILQTSISPADPIPDSEWTDMGVGFTDLQVAVRYYEEGGAVDYDGDGDVERNWYSGVVPAPVTAIPKELSLSLAIRTMRDLNLVPTAATPNFTEGNPDHNRLGNSPSVDLVNTPDGSRPMHLRGNHIYRWVTIRVDLRNLGVGR